VQLPVPARWPHFASLFAARTFAIGLLLLLIGGFLLREGLIQVRRGAEAIERTYSARGVPKLPGNDFPMFFAGASAAASSERARLYDPEVVVKGILHAQGYAADAIPPQPDPDAPEYQWLRYYNPPAYLLAFSPLTFLDVRTAYLVALGINLGLLAALVAAIGQILRWRQPHSTLLVLALLAFVPVYFALHHAQPTVLIALLVSLGYLALRSGRRYLGGALLALTGVKPHWLLTIAAGLKDRQALIVLVASAAAFICLPFLFVGPEAAFDWVRLMLGRGSGDVQQEGYGSALMGWAGFVHAITGQPQAWLWLPPSLLTLALFAAVWLRGSGPGVTLAAAILAGLLAVPHSLPQDWMLVVPVAAILLSLRWTPLGFAGICAGLLGILAGANDWLEAQRAVDEQGSAVLWVTLAAFALLLWLALLVWLTSVPDEHDAEAQAPGEAASLVARSS